MANIAAIGELLIDWVPIGRAENGCWMYECHPGGAPANLLSCAAQFGHTASMIACVGKDVMGAEIRAALEQAHVSAAHVQADPAHLTTLALVGLTPEGERNFSFYRDGCADLQLSPAMIDESFIASLDVLCLGSLSLMAEPSRSAVYHAVELAKRHHVLIAYDPNDRPFLWRDRKAAKETMLAMMKNADIVKISEEELFFLTGMADTNAAAAELLRLNPCEVLFVTAGAKGSAYYTKDGKHAFFGPAGTEHIVDTTGAGDYFFGGALSVILQSKKALSALTDDDLSAACRMGNACGYAVATHKGALGVQVAAEVEALLHL